MSKITVLNERSIAVEVQSLAYGFNIWIANFSLQGYKKGDWYLTWMNGIKGEKQKLPEGTWSILAKGNEMTEEQWKGIVESVAYDVPPSPGNDWQGDWRSAWRDYDSDIETGYSEYPFVTTAAESGLSLLKSKGLNPGTIIILIKQ